LLYRIDSGSSGCSACCFSKSGFYFAVSVFDETYQIRLYDTCTAYRIATLEGHQDLIYSLNWSHDEKYLYSASSDGCVKVWNVFEELINTPILTDNLQHPCFVYCAQMHPDVSSSTRLIFTGSYDSKIRIWKVKNSSEKISKIKSPIKEILGHASYITKIAFDSKGEKMFTGDGNGVIQFWNIKINDLKIECLNTIKLDNDPIGSISVHPMDRKITVTNRRTAKTFDLRLFRFLTEYSVPVHNDSKQMIVSCISPCGSYVMCSDHYGCVHVFHIDSAKAITIYKFDHQLPVNSISVHPYDHMVAFSSLGKSQPILIYTYDGVANKETAEVLSEKKMESEREFTDKDLKHMTMAMSAMKSLSGSIIKIEAKEAKTD
jgi:WD40 repeat protein